MAERKDDEGSDSEGRRGLEALPRDFDCVALRYVTLLV